MSVGNNFVPVHVHQYIKLSIGLPNNSMKQKTGPEIKIEHLGRFGAYKKIFAVGIEMGTTWKKLRR